jgi:hypothetical protein
MNEPSRTSARGLAGLLATYVYVSNAEDGDIGVYTMDRDGALKPGANCWGR